MKQFNFDRSLVSQHKERKMEKENNKDIPFKVLLNNFNRKIQDDNFYVFFSKRTDRLTDRQANCNKLAPKIFIATLPKYVVFNRLQKNPCWLRPRLASPPHLRPTWTCTSSTCTAIAFKKMCCDIRFW